MWKQDMAHKMWSFNLPLNIWILHFHLICYFHLWKETWHVNYYYTCLFHMKLSVICFFSCDFHVLTYGLQFSPVNLNMKIMSHVICCFHMWNENVVCELDIFTSNWLFPPKKFTFHTWRINVHSRLFCFFHMWIRLFPGVEPKHGTLNQVICFVTWKFHIFTSGLLFSLKHMTGK